MTFTPRGKSRERGDSRNRIAKCLWAVIFLTLTGAAVNATERFEVSAYGGAMLGGQLGVRHLDQNGDLNIIDGAHFGLAFNVTVSSGIQIELMYNHQPTRMEFEAYPSGAKEKLFDMSVSYLQLAGVREFGIKGHERLRPFGSLGFGLTYFNPRNSEATSAWVSSVGFGAGIKAFLSDYLGLRLHTRFLFPIYLSSGSFFCDPGGCGAYINGGSTMFQLEPAAGVIVAF